MQGKMVMIVDIDLSGWRIADHQWLYLPGQLSVWKGLVRKK